MVRFDGYVLLNELRRIALRHTQFADASCGTIRVKLLKIGALVRRSEARPGHPPATRAAGATGAQGVARSWLRIFASDCKIRDRDVPLLCYSAQSTSG